MLLIKGLFKKLFGRPPKLGKPRTVTDESFAREVINVEIPVVVDFWSSRCPPCHVMGGLLNEIGPEYQGRLDILKLNVERNPVSAARYQIRSVPTIIAFNKGKQVRRIAGLIPIDQLRQLFDRLAGQERILREKAV